MLTVELDLPCIWYFSINLFASLESISFTIHFLACILYGVKPIIALILDLTIFFLYNHSSSLVPEKNCYIIARGYFVLVKFPWMLIYITDRIGAGKEKLYIIIAFIADIF